MEKKRLDIILSNILGELFDKTFECNCKEFISYLRTEIGITNSEIYNLCKVGLFPKKVEHYFLNEEIKSCVEFEDENSADYLRYYDNSSKDDQFKIEPR